MVVSRKVGKAVVRNRIRRRLREALRRMLASPPSGALGSGPEGLWPRSFDMLIIVRPSAVLAPAAELPLGLKRAIDRASEAKR